MRSAPSSSAGPSAMSSTMSAITRSFVKRRIFEKVDEGRWKRHQPAVIKVIIEEENYCSFLGIDAVMLFAHPVFNPVFPSLFYGIHGFVGHIDHLGWAVSHGRKRDCPDAERDPVIFFLQVTEKFFVDFGHHRFGRVRIRVGQQYHKLIST